MDMHQLLLRTLYLLPLIIPLQASSSAAFPFAGNKRHTNEAQDTDCPPEARPLPPHWRSVSGIDFETTLSSTPYTSDSWNPTAYQIGDGQVQVPYAGISGATTVTSSDTAFVSTSTVSDYYSDTPVPRQVTARSISTSYTTVYVTANSSPAPAETASVNVPAPAVTSIQPSVSTSTTTTTTTLPDESLTSLTTSEVQSVTAPPVTDTSGVVQTTLETSGEPSLNPFPTATLRSSTSLSLVDTATLSDIGPTATTNPTAISADDIFQPIASDAPPPQIPSRSDHPVARLGIQPQQKKLETNKFYANFFLGEQTEGTWTHPYSVSWSKGVGQSSSWGLAIAHIERDQFATGPKTSSDTGENAFFAAPIGIQSLVLSAVELGAGTTLTTDMLEAFSVNVNLAAAAGSLPLITFPLVQGMGFVTAKYNIGTPLVQSGIGMRNVTYAGGVINGGSTFKYRILLTDGFTWLMYVTPLSPGYNENSFTLVNLNLLQGASGFGGYIQVAKVPPGVADAETVYDGSAGVYATETKISGSVDGTTGSYTLAWTKQGTAAQPLLMYALPHHVESMDGTTSAGVTDVQLITTTKGTATAIRGDFWTLVEPGLPITMGFSPWSPTLGDVSTLSLAAVEAIVTAGTLELSQNISKQANVGSMYYDGKALAKFAAIVYVLHEMAHNTTLALTGLLTLEQAFALHINNQQTFPLVYDTAWGGVVSSSTYLSGNAGKDFGNSYYNDHHFHYSYFVYAAAVIGYLDPSWLAEGTNKQWVDALARDYANPVSDNFFPFSRSFDWFHGHSWAKGLFPTADGKDQESSSEDTLASYALKMWGRTNNDKNMEARGNLMLAIQARSFSNYVLYMDSNSVEPSGIIGNKVSGILFENKIDHTTYFGNSIENIQGIHMLPLMPVSTFIRSQAFVQQEWNAYNFASYAATLQTGWRGILMANLAIIDPATSYNFFSNASGDFNYGLLDGGASQTWYLAWSAALGGGP